MTARIEDKNFLFAQPSEIARGIHRAVTRPRNVVYLPSFWRLIMLIIRGIPESLFKRLSL
jgi:short-subunit dehydrogenase